jgi:hypothetical protein
MGEILANLVTLSLSLRTENFLKNIESQFSTRDVIKPKKKKTEKCGIALLCIRVARWYIFQTKNPNLGMF